jgi:phage baseplate assembly protein V
MSGETWNTQRCGQVFAVDYEHARVMVDFDELDSPSDWLPVLQRGAGDVLDYWLPAIGEHVVCIFYSDGTEEGVVLGSYYPLPSPPPDFGSGLYYTIFPDGSSIRWEQGLLTITAAASVMIDGDTTVDGDLNVTGSVDVTGTVTAAAFIER